LAEQREEPPNYFTRVEIRHKLRGAVDAGAVERAIELSETKYCSVGRMISKSARIGSTFEIVVFLGSAIISNFGKQNQGLERSLKTGFFGQARRVPETG
jgi:hypothetical protein